MGTVHVAGHRGNRNRFKSRVVETKPVRRGTIQCTPVGFGEVRERDVRPVGRRRKSYATPDSAPRCSVRRRFAR